MLESNFLWLYLKALAGTNAVEIPVVWYLLSQHCRTSEKAVSSRQIIAAAFFGNMATLPHLWFVFPGFFDEPYMVVALGEMTALMVEGFIYYLLVGASLRAAFFTSLLANGGSVVAGLLFMPPF